MKAYKSTRFGVWVFRLERLQLYYQKATSLMILYLFIESAGWSWWYLLVIPAAVVAHLFDKHVKLPAEMDAQTRSNPTVMDIHKMVKELHDRTPHA